jgi:aryl-alcohol dehydrogenase-like predicted oxidoreductase
LLHFPHPAAGEWARELLRDRSFDIADANTNTAEQLGATPAATAIAWIASRPAVSSVIIGPRTLDQLRDNLDGIKLEIPDEQRSRLDSISAPTNGPVTGILTRQRAA